MLPKGSKSNCGWVFVSEDNYIRAYDCGGNLMWTSASLGVNPLTLGIADFDGDGLAEIYTWDVILAAESGIILVKTSGNGCGAPVAVDILDASGKAYPPNALPATFDNKLELVSGLNIYAVNIVGRTATSGSSITLKVAAPAKYLYAPDQAGYTSTFTSVADYNQDGSLDIIATGQHKYDTTITTKTKHGTTVTVNPITNAKAFFYDVYNKKLLSYGDSISGSISVNSCPPSSGYYYLHGWQSGLGRINIADVDGDGKLNASYVSGRYLYSLKEDFTLLWRTQVNEETSGYTGCTVYDFNGDGAAEVVYRDERALCIYDGKTGLPGPPVPCIARTNIEYPIVVDVDGDGHTEICVTCATSDTYNQANFCDLTQSLNSEVRVFESGNIPWVPARRLWNQHAYFNANVDDSLKIPKIIQKQTAVFSSGVCTVSSNRPLNSS